MYSKSDFSLFNLSYHFSVAVDIVSDPAMAETPTTPSAVTPNQHSPSQVTDKPTQERLEQDQTLVSEVPVSSEQPSECAMVTTGVTSQKEKKVQESRGKGQVSNENKPSENTSDKSKIDEAQQMMENSEKRNASCAPEVRSSAGEGERGAGNKTVPSQSETCGNDNEGSVDTVDKHAGLQNSISVTTETAENVENGAVPIMITVKSPSPLPPASEESADKQAHSELPPQEGQPGTEEPPPEEQVSRSETPPEQKPDTSEGQSEEISPAGVQDESDMNDKSQKIDEGQATSDNDVSEEEKIKEQRRISRAPLVSAIRRQGPSLEELQKVMNDAAEGLDLAVCRTVLTNLHSQNSGLNQELQERDCKIARMQTMHQTQSETLRLKQEQWAQLKLDYAKVLSQLEEKTRQNIYLQEDSRERDRLRTELTDLRQQNKILENELKSVQAKREYLEGEQRRLKHRENNIEIKMKEIRESQDEKSENIRQLNTRLNKATACMEKVGNGLGPLLLTWISNYIQYKVWYEITYPCLNFNGATVDV